jgi:hypothetical protein
LGHGYQIIEGPVLVALQWLDGTSILRELATLQGFGYLPNVRFKL